MRGLKEMLARLFLGSGPPGWPGPREDRARGAPRPDGVDRPPRPAPGEGEEGEGEGGAGGALPPLKPDWRDIVAFTIAMYQILAVPFLLFCGVALFIYLLLWLWAR